MEEIGLEGVDAGVAAYDSGDYRTALRLLRPLAISGNAKAQYYLGQMYLKGRGVIKSQMQASDWIGKAAAQGYGNSETVLGKIKESSNYFVWRSRGLTPETAAAAVEEMRGISQKTEDYGEPLSWCEQDAKDYVAECREKMHRPAPAAQGILAPRSRQVVWSASSSANNRLFSFLESLAEKGDAGCAYHAGMMKLFSDSVERDPECALSWLRIAADAGIPKALANLARIELYGPESDRDESAGAAHLKKAADLGEPEAQNILAARLLVKDATAEERREGARRLRDAAEAGLSKALVALGDAYAAGKVGFRKDVFKAEQCYLKAIEKDFPLANYSLGKLLIEKNPPNFPAGISRVMEAVDKNLPEALCYAGYLYEHGIAVTQNEARSDYMYSRAAEQGSMAAIMRLADRHDAACEYQDAFNWYRRAAERECDAAQYKLAYYIENHLINIGVLDAEDSAVKKVLWTGESGKIERKIGGAKYEQEAFAWYRRGASNGNVDCEYAIAHMYDEGIGVNQNREEALRWYKVAADHGNPSAQIMIASCHERGDGLEKSESEALKWYRSAAEAGDARAYYSLGKLFEEGKGVRQDSRKAVECYTKAADLGNADALFRLGQMYESSYMVSRNPGKSEVYFSQAMSAGHKGARREFAIQLIAQGGESRTRGIKLLEEAVRDKDRNAYRILGEAFAGKSGGEKNMIRAIEMFRYGAESGDAVSQYELGRAYETGDGVERNYIDAFRWYAKAEQNGCAKASYRMGMCMIEGRGTQKDLYRGAAALKRASRLGDDEASIELGKVLESGAGIDADAEAALACYAVPALKGNVWAQKKSGELCVQIGCDDQALSWIEKAAKQGDAEAAALAGDMFYKGIGCDKNYAKAHEYYNAAAKSDIPSAVRGLARMTEMGRGTEQNMEKAFELYARAASLGDTQAMFKRGRMLLNGIGCKISEKEGVAELTKAAGLGSIDAQYVLATMYSEGNSVHQDKSKAYVYICLAIAGGCDYADAEPLRETLRSQLSEDELSAAQEKAHAMFTAGQPQ